MLVSPNNVLPDELLMEILSRVDSSNHLDLRCVCKSWKSLVHDPQFMKNHLLRSITDLASLSHKIMGHFTTFKSHIINNPLLVTNVGEEEVDGDGADCEDEDEDEDDDDDDDDEEEEEEEEEEEGEEEEEEELQLNAFIKLDNLVEKEERLKKKRKNTDKIDEKMMIIMVAKLDNFLVVVRYMKSFMLNYLKSLEDRDILNENLESIRVEMQTVEDRLMCFKIFMQMYLTSISMFSVVQPIWNFMLGN